MSRRHELALAISLPARRAASATTRLLGVHDLPACVRLAESRGWPADEEGWRQALEFGDIFGCEVDGETVGTVTLSRFGDLAVVARLVVTPDLGGQGLGHLLVREALKRARGATVSLYATETSRSLFGRVGFGSVGAALRLAGLAAPVDAARVDGLRPIRASDLTQIWALDEEAQGGLRRRLLEHGAGAADRALVVHREGTLVGFGFAARRGVQRVLAPIIAREDRDARALAAALCEDSTEPVRLDLQPDERALLVWARDAGLTVVESAPLMTYARARLPGRRSLVRALAGRSFG